MPDYKYNPNQGSRFYRSLVDVQQTLLFHESHKLPMAHPAEILSESLGEVSKLFTKLVTNVQTSDSLDDRENLTKSLIFSLNEFYDRLFLIIKCFTAPTSSDDDRDILGFLKANNQLAVTKFYGSTKIHHELIRGVANSLKHKHSKLAFLDVVNHNDEPVSGFYVQVVIGLNDLRGPDPTIHNIYRGKIHTSFSYNHFLLNVVGRIFNYLDWLEKTLFEIKPKKSRPLAPLSDILTSATKLKIEFFPDEYFRAFAKIEQIREASYIVQFPVSYTKRTGMHPDMIRRTTGHADFNTRTNSSHAVFPYLQLCYPDKDLGLLPMRKL